MKKLLFFAALAILILPVSANAAQFLQGDLVAPADPIDEDLFAGANRVDIRHEVRGDAFLGGQTINVTSDAEINGDIFAAGNNITIDGTLTDDLIVGGENITINSPRIDDLFAGGTSISISPDTVITGDAYIGGATITMAGTIAGDVRIGGDTVIIQSGTTIEGNLHTWGKKKPTIESGVTINGNTEHYFPAAAKQGTTVASKILLWVRSVVTWFVSALALLYLFPGFTQKILSAANSKTAVSFGIGALVLIFFLPLSVLLFITQVGLPLGFIVLTCFIPLLITSLIYVNLLVGQFVYSKITKTKVDKLNWQHAILGVLVVKIALFIPILGGLAAFILVVLTLGAVSATCWQLKRA